MAITPINISRTSFNMQMLSLLESLRQNTLQLFLEQNRLATGNRLNAPSEDPVLGTRVTELTEILERQEQVLSNIRHGDSFLAATDVAIGEVNDLLTQAHSIALEMVNSHADADQRASMAELVMGIIDQLVMVGNRTYLGVYLLAGQQTTTLPFTQNTGGVEYRGDSNPLVTRVDAFQAPQINLTGQDVFGVLNGRIEGYVDLNPALTDDTRLADVKGTTGKGVNVSGPIRISLDSPSTTFTVDLSTADTIGDVIDMINRAAEDAGLTVGPGGDFNASLNATLDGLQLEAGGSTLTVEDLGAGVTARDLGIRGTGFPAIAGADIDAKVTKMTQISSLFGGAGTALGTIQVTSGETTEIINLGGAVTVQDILNRLNSAEIEIRAEINADGTGIDVVNIVSGVSLQIGENGGNFAETLGLRTYHGATRLSDLNNGCGVNIREGFDDLLIQARDGSSFAVRLDGAQTVQDVLDLINGAAATAGVNVSAGLAPFGNGIRLIDNTGGAGQFAVIRAGSSEAIDGLGLNKTKDSPELLGDDVSGVEPNSVFTALIKLHDALARSGPNVEQEITEASELLQAFIRKTTTIQGVIGARSRAMATRLDLTENAVVATQRLLSELKDLDYTEAITRFQQAQTTLQANLMTGSRLLQLSLMNYI